MKIPKGKPGGRLLDWDSERGVASYWHWDKQLGKGIIEMVQDTKPIVYRNEAIKAQENELTKSKDFRYLGSVPMTQLMDWIKEGKISQGPIHQVKDQAWIKKKLNDPKYSKFRASTARV